MREARLFGYAGRILHVDLTKRAVNIIPVTREMIRDYIGGFGFAAKLVYEFLAPQTDPLSADNVLVFGAPLLGGTFVPTGGRTVVMGKSPLTGLFGISHMGEPGAMLKLAGYDQLLITGRASRPSYLKIQDDTVEILSADHLWGLSVPETTDALWRDLGGEFYISCIGPAGENLVRFASILTNKYSAAGRCGLGAVMGSKNLKAIAICGGRAIEVAHPGKVERIAKEVFTRMLEHPSIPGARKYGTLFQISGELGRQLSRQRYYNDGTMVEPGEVFDIEQYYNRIRARNLTCFACPVGCKQEIELKQGEFAGSHFAIACSVGTMARPFGYQLSVKKYEDIAKCAELNNSYGMDAHVIDHTIALFIDLQHRGIITPETTDGMNLEWGDARAIMALIRKTALREGFGNLLAEGPVRACKKLGLNPDDFVAHSKGNPWTPNMDARRDFGPPILGGCLNPRGAHFDYHRPVAALTLLPDHSYQHVKAICERLGVSAEEIDTVVTGEGRWFCNIAQLTRYVEDFSIVVYCFGTCDRDYINPDVYNIKIYADLFSAVTGIAISVPQLLQAGERIWTLQRMFNMREGASRKDDQLPKLMYMETLKTVSREFPPFNADEFNRTLDEYYAIRGWDKEGRPTKTKLAELGLQ